MPPFINWGFMGHWANWIVVLEVMLVMMILGTFLKIGWGER